MVIDGREIEDDVSWAYKCVLQTKEEDQLGKRVYLIFLWLYKEKMHI